MMFATSVNTRGAYFDGVLRRNIKSLGVSPTLGRRNQPSNEICRAINKNEIETDRTFAEQQINGKWQLSDEFEPTNVIPGNK